MRKCACGAVLEYSGHGRRPSTCRRCKLRLQRGRQARFRASAQYRSRRKPEKPEKRQRYTTKLRAEVLAGYGGRCACCGETEHRFLTLDHVEGGGYAERKLRGTWPIYAEARRLGYPPRFQLLCWNCNHGRALNDGVCPHKSRLRAVA